MDQDTTCTEVGLGLCDIVLDGDPAPTERGKQLFSPRILWPNGRPSQQLLSSLQNNTVYTETMQRSVSVTILPAAAQMYGKSHL